MRIPKTEPSTISSSKNGKLKGLRIPVLSQQPNRASRTMRMQNLKLISALTSSDNAQPEEENDATQVAT
jgi:hypothetical protein